MAESQLTDLVAAYYADKVRTHGASPGGVDWNSAESQQLRFRQLMRVIDHDDPYSLTDYGCGYGALLTMLRTDRRLRSYQGYDIAPSMLDAAREHHAGAGGTHRFTAAREQLQPTDYVVASGIFNVKLDVTAERWRDHILTTLGDIAGLARIGFAFNVLTSFSDPARHKPHLFYAEPGWLFDHTKRHLAGKVCLLHDYPLFEFTILARK